MTPVLLLLVLLFEVPGLSFSESAAVSAQAPNSSSASLQKGWIVEGNVTGKLAPTCSNLCVVVLNDEKNLPAILQPCEGGPPLELWTYDAEKMAFVSDLGFNALLCLDASDPNELHLSACNGSASQIWIWDSKTMRLKNGNSSGVDMYMQGEYRKPSDWGTGKNTYSLKLGTENSQTDFIFTLLPFYDPILIRPPEPSANSENLVLNGGFEKCGFDPGKGFLKIDTTQLIPLCSWFIASNEVEYSGPNLWHPEEGNHSVHLNSARTAMPAALTQILPTKVNSNYSLHLYMSGNPDLACGTWNKTMEIRVSGSSLQPQVVWFDINNGGVTGWRSVGPVGFTALADYVNLTFSSLTPGSCGPVIDNVSVVEIHGPLPFLNLSYQIDSPIVGSNSSLPTYGLALISSAAAGFVLVGIALLFLQLRRRRNRLKSSLWLPKSSRSTSEERSRFWDSLTLSRLEGENSNARELSWKEIEKATRNFTMIIGEGGFSTVYKAQFPDGTLGAVKMEKTRDRSRQAFRQELSVLVRVRHANLVNLIGFCNERAEGILVFEYMAHGNLHYRLHPPAHQLYQALPWKKRMAIALQVATALEYLHETARPPIVHTDIKSANVLLDAEDNAKVCDFGFSSKAGPESSVFHSTAASVKGSLGYLDPQYLKNGRLSSKSDVYSFGVLLMELVTGMHAFDIHRAEALTSFAGPYFKEMEMVEMIVDGRLNGSYDRRELKVVCEISELCVREDGGERPAMGEVVQKLIAMKAATGSAPCDEEEGHSTEHQLQEDEQPREEPCHEEDTLLEEHARKEEGKLVLQGF